MLITDSLHIRRLERELADCTGTSPADIHKKIDLLNDLAWALCDIDLKRAESLSESAYSLASDPANGDSPYQPGMAYSLRTQGYLNQRLGAYPLGLTQLLAAQEICETLSLEAGLPDVYDGIAGIYFQIGNFPEALNYMYKQLEVAQRLGDNRLIANAYNNLANIYFETGDYDRAIKTLQHNLQLAVEIDYKRIESLSYLNLAETHLLAGNPAQALANARHALQVSQAAGFELFEVYAFDLLGKASLKLGEAIEAIQHLEKALALSRRIESKVTESLILLNLGQAYRDLGQLDLAVDYGRQCITIARAIEAKGELFKGHLLLAEIFEQQGDFAQALTHFKQYHAFKEQVFGEKADERLKVLHVAHDTETAQKEAEIFQLKTVQLEQEITERRKAEAALQDARNKLEQQVRTRTAELSETVALLQQEIKERERAEAETQQMVETLEQRVATRTDELVTFFDLTVLAGQAVNLSDVFEQALPRIVEVTRSRIICLHLLEPDHTGLYLAAHQNLPAEARARLQSVALTPGFQRWLQQPNDPLVTNTLSQLGLLPPAFQLPECQTYLGAQIRVGHHTEGLLSCYRFTGRGFGLDGIALVTALAEQLGLVLETHRLRQHTEEMAVLQERQRLARDLHDSVTQSLYSLSLFSRAGHEAAVDGDIARLTHSLTELERTTLHALREMRLLLYELRPADLAQEGLIRAVELRLDTVERRLGLKLKVQMDQLPEMPPDYEVDLYYIIVEAMNNVTKHAAASCLTLSLTQADRQLHLQIADDGQGFDSSSATGGLGLRNIRERVARLNGQISLFSEPGRGTRLEATIPFPMEES